MWLILASMLIIGVSADPCDQKNCEICIKDPDCFYVIRFDETHGCHHREIIDNIEASEFITHNRHCPAHHDRPTQNETVAAKVNESQIQLKSPATPHVQTVVSKAKLPIHTPSSTLPKPTSVSSQKKVQSPSHLTLEDNNKKGVSPVRASAKTTTPPRTSPPTKEVNQDLLGNENQIQFKSLATPHVQTVVSKAKLPIHTPSSALPKPTSVSSQKKVQSPSHLTLEDNNKKGVSPVRASAKTATPPRTSPPTKVNQDPPPQRHNQSKTYYEASAPAMPPSLPNSAPEISNYSKVANVSQVPSASSIVKSYTDSSPTTSLRQPPVAPTTLISSNEANVLKLPVSTPNITTILLGCKKETKTEKIIRSECRTFMLCNPTLSNGNDLARQVGRCSRHLRRAKKHPEDYAKCNEIIKKYRECKKFRRV